MEKACYKFSSKKLKSNYDKIISIFSKDYSDFKLAYSFKTNFHPVVLNSVLKTGALAEVVSPEEYLLAKKTGFEIKNIIYNGVCKDKESFLDCALHGGKVNIDNENDIQFALDYFNETKTPLALGLRISFDIHNGIKSHFGINVESETFQKILHLNKEKKLIINGIHCHFTNSKAVKYWKQRAENMCKFSEFFENLEYLDFGGNMYSMSEFDIMQEYADIIIPQMNDCFLNYSKKPSLILETGTPLISDAVNLVCTAQYRKENYIFLDCSIFDLGLNSTNDRLQIQVTPCKSTIESKLPKDSSPKTLVGYTCLENDVLKKSYCGTIYPGDKIIFKNIGAYSISWANKFIKPELSLVDCDISQ